MLYNRKRERYFVEQITIKKETEQEQNEKTNFTWVDEYPTVLDIINEYYSFCR